MAGRRTMVKAAVSLATAASIAAALPGAAEAQTSPWWSGDQAVILGYGCTAIPLEPYDSRFNCPSYVSHVHEGMDIDLPYGTPIRAGWPGTVVEVGSLEAHDYGPHYVKIWLEEGHDVCLGHLSAAVVVPGQRVEIGTVIGYVGDLGVSDIPNLDFSVRPHGGGPYQSIDPSAFLAFLDLSTVSEGYTARDARGRVQVLARWQMDGRVWATDLVGGWTAIPGGPSEGFAAEPLVRNNGSGQLIAFVVGADGALWTSSQLDPPGAAMRWRPWRSLGNPSNLEPRLIGSPAAGMDPDGSLHVFVRGGDGMLWETRHDRAADRWSGWDAAPFARDVAGDPTAARDSTDRLEVLVAARDGTVQVNRQARAGGPWTGWLSIGAPAGSGAGYVGRPALVRDAAGVLELFVVTTAGSVFATAQSSSGGSDWAQWTSIGCCTNVAVAALVRPDGRLQLFELTRSGSLVTTFSNNGVWSRWAELAHGLSGEIAVALAANKLPVVLIGSGAGKMTFHLGDPSRLTGARRGTLLTAFVPAQAGARTVLQSLRRRGHPAPQPVVV